MRVVCKSEGEITDAFARPRPRPNRPCGERRRLYAERLVAAGSAHIEAVMSDKLRDGRGRASWTWASANATWQRRSQRVVELEAPAQPVKPAVAKKIVDAASPWPRP